MKILFVAVVSGLISVCQPAPLACEQLVKPVDNGPVLTGKWYYIAFSTDTCWASTLFNTLFSPSLIADVTPKDTPNMFENRVYVKMYGYCYNESETAFYENGNKIFDVNSDSIPTGDPDVLLQTSCPDCVVVKSTDYISTLIFLSRRSTVSDAELQEFEIQAKCLGWSKPQVFSTDHDFGNCKSVDDDLTDDQTAELAKAFSTKLKEAYENVLTCFKNSILSYFSSYFSSK